MIIEVSALATLLQDPLNRLTTWTFGKVLTSVRNQQIEHSLSKLSERLTEVVKVKTIYKGDSSIDLHEFYVPTRVRNVSRRINSITDIDIENIVLEGTVGQGKSIFMRYLTYKEAKKGDRIPIFFELRKLEENQSLEEAISATISEWIPLFSKDKFSKLAESGDLVLFLDGFDEVRSDDLKALLNEIESWHKRYPKMQLIISSRPQSDIQKMNIFSVRELAPYTYPEQEALIDKLVTEIDTRSSLKNSIRESASEIKELLTTPLMVTLYVMIYRALSDPPKTQSEFYENIFSILSTRHDKTKPGYKREFNSQLGETSLQAIFEEVCFISVKQTKLVFSYPELKGIIQSCLTKQNIEADASEVLLDFSKVICLLPKDGLNYTFMHRSIQEYFYASFLLSRPESLRKKFYKKYLTDYSLYQKTQGIIRFLEDTDKYNYMKHCELPLIEEFIKNFDVSEYSSFFLKNMFIKSSNNNDRIELRLVSERKLVLSKFYYPEQIDNIFCIVRDFISAGNCENISWDLYDDDRTNLIGLGFIQVKDILSEEDLDTLEYLINEESKKLIRLYKDFKRYIATQEKGEF